MKRIGIAAMAAAAIGLAGLAASSVAAAAGSPEYLACGKAAKNKETKKYTGKYTNKACSEESLTSEGKYERVAETKFPIKTKAKFGETKIYLYNPPEHKIEAEVPCEKGAATGTINDSREETVTLSYSGCKVPPTGKFPGPCNSPGEKPGVVVSKPLTTKLVWLDEEETVPGIVVSPTEPGGVFEEVECLVGHVMVKQTGSILAKIAPVGEVVKTLTATFTASPTTGEPEFGAYYEGATKTEVKLFSEIHAPDGIEEEAVPTSETSAIPEKDGKVLIG